MSEFLYHKISFSLEREKMQEFTEQYLFYLNRDFKGINLTRILDPHEFLVKQVEDSLVPYLLTQQHFFQKRQDFFDECQWVDVGFGGGFPLLVLAWFFPERDFLGIEARAKKAQVVEKLASLMGINNIRTKHQRLEDYVLNQSTILSFKAVGLMHELLALIDKRSLSQKKRTRIGALFYKGPVYQETKTREESELAKLDWSISFEDHFCLSDTSERSSVFLELRKEGAGK